MPLYRLGSDKMPLNIMHRNYRMKCHFQDFCAQNVLGDKGRGERWGGAAGSIRRDDRGGGEQGGGRSDGGGESERSPRRCLAAATRCLILLPPCRLLLPRPHRFRLSANVRVGVLTALSSFPASSPPPPSVPSSSPPLTRHPIVHPPSSLSATADRRGLQRRPPGVPLSLSLQGYLGPKIFKVIFHSVDNVLSGILSSALYRMTFYLNPTYTVAYRPFSPTKRSNRP